MEQTNGHEGGQSSRSTDFGIFYPMGYIVVAFPLREDAVRVQRELMLGGYELADCAIESSQDVSAASERNLKENPGWIARLGMSDEAVQLHLDAANKGATFLLIYAPGDTDAERAMNVVRRVPFELAHRYRRFAIEDMMHPAPAAFSVQDAARRAGAA